MLALSSSLAGDATADLGDVAEQFRWERRARGLLQRLSVATAVATQVDVVMQIAVDEICAATGWPVGHVLVMRDGALRSAGVWHVDEPERFARFREVTAASAFTPGVGLPGRVLASGRPLWIMDVTVDENFPRAHLTPELAVRAAFAFPVILQDEVTAVLEFFARTTAEPDPPLLDVMEAIGAQLGRVLERVSAEDALRASELRFRSVVQTANDAIVSADGAGRIVFWNRCAATMFGYAGEEIIGMPLTSIIPERFRAAHDAGMARVRQGGARHVIGKTVELQGLRSDGSEFPIELSLATWSAGGETFYTGIIRDIAQRKGDEATLVRLAQQLEASERHAIEASRAKSTFLANMSHELRTPLNAILGFVQLMGRDRNLTERQQDNLGIILRSGEHLLGLINDVLSISKIEAGHTALNPTDFDLRQLVGSLRDLFLPQAQAKGLQLVVEPIELPPRVRGDEAKLRQVLMNLLSNAIKVTDSGGALLRVRWSGEVVDFAVEDTGRGIEAAALRAIFEPFVQAAAGKQHSDGTGLGLAISRHFVGLMGGELGVTSTLDEGTRFFFSVRLPEAAGGAPVIVPRQVVRLRAGQPEQRVLIVENDPSSRLLLHRLLSSVGFAVREAPDGEIGVAVWNQWRPHLVFMDMRMPVLDGYAATRTIRVMEGSSQRPRTVIIGLTASAFENDRPRILAAGCDEIIGKPFREVTLFDAIARSLGVSYEHVAPTEAPATTWSEGGVLPGVVAALPAAWRDQLGHALAAGDDLAAGGVIARLGPDHGAIALELARMVKGFQFDELLALLERAAAEGA
ncbi:MAG: PAS domain S-box protein [Deltaproteobacteria bacterium]|nr:PAS domain S-box protein [Deltaproteobacteria bacterium]